MTRTRGGRAYAGTGSFAAGAPEAAETSHATAAADAAAASQVFISIPMFGLAVLPLYINGDFVDSPNMTPEEKLREKTAQNGVQETRSGLGRGGRQEEGR
jgi:hypothetical protein